LIRIKWYLWRKSGLFILNLAFFKQYLSVVFYVNLAFMGEFMKFNSIAFA
ncbi:MAG: hypothetical protein RLY60_2254, partial [Pseudomonadota bacterium]